MVNLSLSKFYLALFMVEDQEISLVNNVSVENNLNLVIFIVKT